MFKKNSALLKAWVISWLGAWRATAQSSIPLLKGMLVYQLAVTKKETYVLLVVFPRVCREFCSCLCFLDSGSHYKKDQQRKRLSLLVLFAIRGSGGKLKEGLSVLSVGRRISRQSPFSPAPKWDTYGSALWLIEQLLFAWYVKQWRDGPYSAKTISLDSFVAFECMWTSDFSFPKGYHLNVVRQPREPKKPSRYICKWL